MIKSLYLGQSYDNKKVELPLGSILIKGSNLFWPEAQSVIINTVANMFSHCYPDGASLIFMGLMCQKHDSMLKYNDSFSVGGKTVTRDYSENQLFSDLICEYKLRKKYNQTKSPIFVAVCDPQSSMFWRNVDLGEMVKDSFLYNIFFIGLTFRDGDQYAKNFQHHLKIETDVLMVNEHVVKNNFELLNVPDQLDDSSNLDSFIFPAFTKSSNNFFSLPYKLQPVPRDLDLDDYILLLSKDIILYKDVPSVESSSKEECLMLIENKKKLMSII